VLSEELQGGGFSIYKSDLPNGSRLSHLPKVFTKPTKDCQVTDCKNNPILSGGSKTHRWDKRTNAARAETGGILKVCLRQTLHQGLPGKHFALF
jgi:hypothetical protein